VQLVRRSLKEIHDADAVDAATGVMTIGGLEIGLCYYRAGYVNRPPLNCSHDMWPIASDRASNDIDGFL